MPRRNTPAGNHHPYCVVTYVNRTLAFPWFCSCTMLEAYDVWRETNTILKDSKEQLKKLGDE